MLIKFKHSSVMNDTWPAKTISYLNEDGYITVDARYISQIKQHKGSNPNIFVIFVRIQDDKIKGYPLILIDKTENTEALEAWQAFQDAGKASKVFPEIKKPAASRGLTRPTDRDRL